MRFPILLCLMLASASVVAETYRWVDAQGRTIISDTPPPGRAHSVSKTGSTPPAAPEQSYSMQRAVAEFPVTLFTAPDCQAPCQKARELLNTRGIPFTDKPLQTPEDFEQLKQLIGDAFVPALQVGRQSARGFEASTWNNLLDLAGYPKFATGNKPNNGQNK